MIDYYDTYILGIGTNLGDRLSNIKKSLRILYNIFNILRISSIYESDALLKEKKYAHYSLRYLNLAIAIHYYGNPMLLIKLLKNIEKRMGRNMMDELWAPRVIDIDILIARNTNIKNSYLEIPHKEFHSRDFAFIPAKEIAGHIGLEFRQNQNIKFNNLKQIISYKNTNSFNFL